MKRALNSRQRKAIRRVEQLAVRPFAKIGEAPGVERALESIRAGLPESPQSPAFWRRVWEE